MTETTLRQRLSAIPFPALLGPLQLFLFGPHTLYGSNLAEFSAPFWSLVPHWLPSLMLLSGALVTLGVVLPTRLFRAYVTALFAIGLLLWVQGNLIVGDYGLLDGRPIEFAHQEGRSSYEISLWIVLPVLMVAAARWVMPIAVTGSRLLVLLQALVLGASAWQVSDSVPRWEDPPEFVFELSAHQNVFHIVLDGFQSDAFVQIAQEDRVEVEQSFSGFEFFVNHAGAFTTTFASIPAMLTGTVYRNTEPIQAFIQKQFENGSIFSILRGHGYDVDFLSGLGTGREHATNSYLIPRPYTTYRDYTRFAAWQLIDLTLFRHAPHVIKPWIYNDQAWRLQTLYGRGQSSDTASGRHLPVNGQVFFEEFTRRMTVSRQRPVYKFLHVGIPHAPIALDEECNFIGATGVSREGFIGQARCAVRIVMRFLDRLRDLGVYDDSLIIVSSDHGAALPPRNMSSQLTPEGDLAVIAGGAMALLVVKPPHSGGPLRFSTAPTSLSDIPATILDLLGLPSDRVPGIPASRLAADAERERAYASYGWRNEDWQRSYFRYLDVFSIRGRVDDPSAWRFIETIHDPESALEDRARGLFGSERDGRGRLFRWSGVHSTWYGPPDAGSFEIQIRSISPTPQMVSFSIGSNVVSQLMLDNHAWHTVRMPLPLERSNANSVHVHMLVEPTWRPEGESRRLGVMTRESECTAPGSLDTHLCYAAWHSSYSSRASIGV